LLSKPQLLSVHRSRIHPVGGSPFSIQPIGSFARRFAQDMASRVSRGNYSRLSPLIEPYVRVRIRLMLYKSSSDFGKDSGFEAG
jgi:hypothetical protein